MGNKNILKPKYCVWCGKKTIMESMLLPEIPILEFIEKKINNYGRNKIWGMSGDWSEEKLDSNFEAELLVYDQMLNNIDKKVVCSSCLKHDDKLWDKYYGDTKEDIIFIIDD
jgi:hypothetical protein